MDLSPYEASRVGIGLPSGFLQRYLKQVTYEFELWMFGTLLACIPWGVPRLHAIYNAGFHGIENSYGVGFALLIALLVIFDSVNGPKKSSRVIFHYLMSFCFFVLASIIIVLVQVFLL